MQQGWGSDEPSQVSGDVKRPGTEGLHSVDYNATDGRHNRESGLGPWKSVDDGSGEVTAEDWEHVAKRFPDTGVWKQT
jgi:hypothetical protein